jgi:hypothetical protein
MLKFTSVSIDYDNLRYSAIYLKDGIRFKFDMKPETQITINEFISIIENDEKN